METNWTRGRVYAFAGTGDPGWLGDGGSALEACLDGPAGLAVDVDDNLYVVELFSATVRKIELRTGLISTVVGCNAQGYSGDGGRADQARLCYPEGIAFDGQGNLLITGNHCIRRVNRDTEVITTVAGRGVAGYGGDGGEAREALLNHPSSIVVDSLGNIYTNDYRNDRIRRIEPDGKILTYVGTGEPGYSGDGGPATAARINDVYGLAIDANNNLYFVDSLNFAVRVVEAGTRTISTLLGKGIPGPVLDNWQPLAEAYISGYPHEKGSIGEQVPHAVEVDGEGNVFLADTASCRIRFISRERHQVVTVAGTGIPGLSGNNGPALEARLGVHNLKLVGKRLYFLDFYRNVVRYIAFP